MWLITSSKHTYELHNSLLKKLFLTSKMGVFYF
nr:MAG TPA: hypothetical protein [Caudoviricetes sp.]